MLEIIFYVQRQRLDTLDISHNEIPCKDAQLLERFAANKVISKGLCEPKIAQIE